MMMPRIAALLFVSWAALSAAPAEFFVAPGGADTNSGTSGAPFATLAQAQRAARSARSQNAQEITIWLRGGVYPLTQSLALDERDSGSAAGGLRVAGWPGETARLTGAAPLAASWFAPLAASDPLWSRVEASARANILVANLPQHGLTDFGQLKARGFSQSASAPLELAVGGQILTLARWPNRSAALARTGSVPSAQQVTIASERLTRWSQASEAWMHGLWAQAWADFHLPVANIDASSHVITFKAPPAQFGLSPDHPCYIYNLIEELDEPGEYYLDRQTGNLYVWPVAGPGMQDAQVSLLETPVIWARGARFVTFQNLTVEGGRAALVEVEGGEHVRFQNCLLRNAGTVGAMISGTDNGLDRCQVVDCGEDGVSLEGGDRVSLTAARNFVANTRIARAGRLSWTYKAGVSVEGCGNEVKQNLIEDLPHAAIVFTGNNHTFSGNEVRQVCRSTGDAGAIYTSRGWATQGTRITGNFIHDVQSTESGGVHGVYLDDCASGIEVSGNVFYGISGIAVFCGGGRDVEVRNNLFARCGTGHFNDDRGRQRINSLPGDYWNLLERLGDDGVRYQQNPWSAAFPRCAAIPASWEQIQTGKWRNPEGCVFTLNAGWSNASWTLENNASGTGVFAVYARFDNNDANINPVFAAAAVSDRQQRPAVLSVSLGGFQPIAFSAIGPDDTPVVAEQPPPPARLNSVAASRTTATVSWSSGSHVGNDFEAAYEIQTSIDASTTWQTQATVASSATATEISGLSPNTTYRFRIRAYNGAGQSFSNEAAGTTTGDQPTFGVPVRFEAETGTVLADVGSNGSVGSSDGGLDSGTSIRLYDVGDEVRVAVDVPTTASYRLGVRVRSGGSTGPTVFWPDGYKFRLDGAALSLVGDAQTLSGYDSSYGGCFWGTMQSEAVTLTAGRHLIDIRANTAWSVVDFVEISPAQVMAVGESPRLQLPADLVVEASQGTGAVVNFTVLARDSAGKEIAVTASARSGDIFPVGTTTVTAFATDERGLSATGRFSITVRDTVAPVLTLPGDLVAEADSATGATVDFSVSGRDSVSPVVVIDVQPKSGSRFPLGTSTVIATARDQAGNVATGRFALTVADRTAPTLTVPSSFSVPATDSTGANVSFSTTAYDLVSGTCAVEASPASGSRFNVGVNVVTVSSRDAVGNRATKTFSITVTAVQLSAPTNVAATSGAGAVTLGWSAVPGALVYDVLRSTSGTGPFVTIASGLFSLQFVDRTAESAVSYYYGVIARSGDAASPMSAPVSGAWAAVDEIWTDQDIGNVNYPGSTRPEAGAFVMAGSGADIWSNLDGFHYMHQRCAGDGVFVARVTAVERTDGWAKAGLMLRESTTADSRFVALYATPENGVALQYRTEPRGECAHVGSTGSFPQWLKLVRAGTLVAGYSSSDGTQWNYVGSVQIALPSECRAGLALTSHNPWALCHATFDHVSFEQLEVPVSNPMQRTEAESGYTVLRDLQSNGTVGVSDGNYDSGQSVRLYDSGDRIRLSFNLAQAGSYELRARVRSGGTTGATGYFPAGYAFAVDGVARDFTPDYSSISNFDSAYGGCYWGTLVLSATALGAGPHTIEIEARSAWAVADYIEVVRR